MGLIIKDEIKSNGGNTTEAYIRIFNYTYYKGNSLGVSAHLYLNKGERDANENDMIISKDIQIGNFYFPGAKSLGSASPEEKRTIEIIEDFEGLNTQSIYEFAYAKLKEKLQEKGWTVEDDL